VELVDWDKLNKGNIRLSIACTDLITGSLVAFDTSRGDKISADHIMASCGFIPEFAPVEVDGRQLVDGGLYANAPVELVLHDPEQSAIDLLVVSDLFSASNEMPKSLEQAFARKNDLLFANQTNRVMDIYRKLGQLDSTKCLHVSYRAPDYEAGPEKTFDLSQASIIDRWATGRDDVRTQWINRFEPNG
jgi:NTE family protein